MPGRAWDGPEERCGGGGWAHGARAQAEHGAGRGAHRLQARHAEPTPREGKRSSRDRREIVDISGDESPAAAAPAERRGEARRGGLSRASRAPPRVGWGRVGGERDASPPAHQTNASLSSDDGAGPPASPLTRHLASSSDGVLARPRQGQGRVPWAGLGQGASAQRSSPRSFGQSRISCVVFVTGSGVCRRVGRDRGWGRGGQNAGSVVGSAQCKDDRGSLQRSVSRIDSHFCRSSTHADASASAGGGDGTAFKAGQRRTSPASYYP